MQDVGLIARGPHPIIPGGTVTLLSGITSRGVHGAALCFIDSHVRDTNERYLENAFGNVESFCILMNIPVQNDVALPPNLWRETPACTSGRPRPAHGGVTAKMKTSAELCETESDGDLPKPFQIQSYQDLLQFPEIPVSAIDTPSGKRPISEPVVDAIVVPTIRTAEHLARRCSSQRTPGAT